MTKEQLKSRVLSVLTRHIGRTNAIPMTALHEAVFGPEWRDKINDTRRLRTIITELRAEGIPVVSSAERDGGGYWLASAGSELEAYCSKLRARALKILAQEAKLRRKTLPELIGQIASSINR